MIIPLKSCFQLASCNLASVYVMLHWAAMCNTGSNSLVSIVSGHPQVFGHVVPTHMWSPPEFSNT